MKYKVTHTTTYQYSAPVGVCYNEAKLRPLDNESQTCLESQIEITPAPSARRDRVDFFGNHVAYFDIHSSHSALTVTATSLVSTEPVQQDCAACNKFTWEQVVQKIGDISDDENLSAQQYRLDSPLIIVNQDIQHYAKRSFIANRKILDAVQDLMERIHRDFTYDPDFTTIATPLIDVLKHRRGVCQDFAHLAIGCLRSMGLAARYVSGYIETLPPAGQARLIGADASHAWFSVYIPQMGWIEFDPTNNQMPMDRHIVVAMGRDYQDVTPLKGVIFGGGKHKLDVSVDVANINT